MSDAWLHQPVAAPDESAIAAAQARQGVLTKPPGALGRLEELAVELAGLQRRERPQLERVRVVVFAADHGVAAEGVSAFPQAVTVEMIRNFARGGAAICVLARAVGATLEVVDVGAASAVEPLPGVVSRRAGDGSANFCRKPAMSAGQLHIALAAGREAVERGLAAGMDLFIGGEMGIANTTVATAVASAALQLDPALVAGAGTGLDAAGIGHKAEVVRRALALHREELELPLDILRCVGGFEIAALTGAYIAAAQAGVPVLVDGFITTTAALMAVQINPTIRPWLLFSHHSAERGHGRLLAALEAHPLLSLGLRLGEGSGAATALPLLQLACRLHGEMATFAEAGVSDG
ncbi:nicotinate-nucleotide--dimethylbenzimidazole phosphoribosyltransferase [Sulfurivermis fontis]|uniref:nicotinate-nucleotide--dimethylbenzimidazole phosphoribosyltransferase n=1 Tax=Sulfurivermis fontis TaxID=1972068 RepID=UPI000FDBCAC1|nr:nicotinate-nucleotide--dimethylbenzimidazole phosphoribosyltransferase [Sulfurivermis fontis]